MFTTRHSPLTIQHPATHLPICTPSPRNLCLDRRGCFVPQLSSWGANRRGAVRRKPKSVEISCRRGTPGKGPDIALVLRSLSEAGALLLVTAPLKPSDEIEIEFRTSLLPKPLRAMADVIRVKPVPGDAYCVAVTFQKRLPYSEFSRLTQPG